MATAASSFFGIPGLPGVSGNSNPLSIYQPITPANPIGRNESSSVFTSLLNTINETSLGNLLTGNPSIGDAASSATNPGQPLALNTTGTGVSALSDFFLRAVIIILGFIFVAVGLSMFRGKK